MHHEAQPKVLTTIRFFQTNHSNTVFIKKETIERLPDYFTKNLRPHECKEIENVLGQLTVRNL